MQQNQHRAEIAKPYWIATEEEVLVDREPFHAARGHEVAHFGAIEHQRSHAAPEKNIEKN
jgi:hypothetical protein